MTATSIQCSKKMQTNVLTNKKLQRVNTTNCLTDKKKKHAQRKQQPTFHQMKNHCTVCSQRPWHQALSQTKGNCTADATDTESTVSLIMRASAADPCDGEHPCVDGRTMMPSKHGQSARDKAVESEQSTKLDKLDSARCHTHIVFRAKKLMSALLNELRAASSSNAPLRRRHLHRNPGWPN
jgi:hypothetical protein